MAWANLVSMPRMVGEALAHSAATKLALSVRTSTPARCDPSCLRSCTQRAAL